MILEILDASEPLIGCKQVTGNYNSLMRIVGIACAALCALLACCDVAETPPPTTPARKQPTKSTKSDYSASVIYAAALKYERDERLPEAVLLLTCVAERFPTEDPGLRAAERLPGLIKQESTDVVRSTVNETQYCPRCSGSGHIRERCPACGGSGTYSASNPGNCFRCRGSGSIDVTCGVCGGSGKVISPREFNKTVTSTIENSIAARRAYFVVHYPRAGLTISENVDEATRLVAHCLPREIRKAIDDEPRRKAEEQRRQEQRSAMRERIASAIMQLYPQTNWSPEGVFVGSRQSLKIDGCRVVGISDDYAVGADPRTAAAYQTSTWSADGRDLSEDIESPETANFVKFHTKGHRALAHYEYRFHGDERPAYAESENRDFLLVGLYEKQHRTRIVKLFKELVGLCAD